MVLGIRGWIRVGLGVEIGGFRNQGVDTGRFRYICKVGGVGSGSNLAPWIFCSAVRTISNMMHLLKYHCL